MVRSGQVLAGLCPFQCEKKTPITTLSIRFKCAFFQLAIAATFFLQPSQ